MPPKVGQKRTRLRVLYVEAPLTHGGSNKLKEIGVNMSAVQDSVDDYILGSSTQEQKRLKMQADFLERWTEQFLRSAGLEPGMSVLDLGCGMGDVSALAAKLVGTTGHVTGIDRDPVVIEKARERFGDEARGAGIEFLHTDLLGFQADRMYDAVIGRYVLMYQADPVATIAHAAKQVRPQGIILFHEMDIARCDRFSQNTLFERVYTLIEETFRRASVSVVLGSQLTRLFLDAGLPWPTVKAEVPIAGKPGSFIYPWFTETLRSLLPRIEQLGLAKAEELELDTLVGRMETEVVHLRTQQIGPVQFGAWTTTVA